MPNIIPAITAIEAWLPEDRLTNADLEKMVDTTDNWILERTGISERRILKGENQGASVLGINALNNLLKNNNIDPLSIEGLICCSTNGDFKYPSTAAVICRETGLKNAFGYDVVAACAGFIFALDIAQAYIKTGKYKRLVVVCAEKITSIANYKDRASCILFGDAGSAALIEPSPNEYGIKDVLIKTDGQGADQIIAKAGGSYIPLTPENISEGLQFFKQEGKNVFKHAVMDMEDACRKVVERNGMALSDMDYFIPHQANKRIIETIAQRTGIPFEKIIINIEKYGNTSSATVPVCIWEWQNKFKKGDKLLLTAFGAGYSYGAAYITWAL